MKFLPKHYFFAKLVIWTKNWKKSEKKIF